MGCCCSLPVPIVWAGHDVGGYDAGEQFEVVKVDSEAHAHWDAAVEVLARAFCGTESTAPDPVVSWVYGGATELGPLSAAPSELRAGWFKWFLSLCAHICLNVGGLYALVEKASGQVVAATGVLPPGARGADIGMYEYSQIAKKLGDLGGMAGPTVDSDKGGWERRNGVADKTMGVAHKELMPEEHLYVLLFATTPDKQRTGAGTVLLSFLNHMADTDSVPCYLESSGENGPAFFKGKGGYEEKKRVPLEDSKGTGFEDSGGMACMVRAARKKELAAAP